jgi:hypothetical protein
LGQDGSVPASTSDFSAKVGHYTQTVDSRGTTHIKGRDARGRPYDLVVDKNGYVEASVGGQVVNFRIKNAG